jgi:hypothetical protein
MEQFKIDPEFRDLIPPQSEDEHKRLEENILEDGEVREPIVVWNETIIDGHNRWAIIQQHPEIPYTVKKMDFPDKWAAKVWICRNQLGRRNLSEEQRAYIVKNEYESQAKTVKNPYGNNQYTKEVSDPTGLKPKNKNPDTRDIVAEAHGMSPHYVQNAIAFGRGLDVAEKASPGIKTAVLSGEVKAPKSLIAKIRNTPEEKRPAAVQAIKDGNIKEAKEIIMENPKKEIKDETLKKVIADLYDTEKTISHTVDDLLEDLDAMISNFASMMRRSITTKADWCKTDEEKERVRAKLSEVDAVIDELRGKMA